MIDFETSASDPKRLFQASFQLMEEERWRKTCFPNLLQLDDLLIKAVQELEWISEKHFLVGNRRYLDILTDEIADRTSNQTFFGFLNTEPNHDRPVRSKSRPNSLYSSTQSVSISTNNTIKKSKTLTVPLSESPTQEIPPSNDVQPRRSSNAAMKRRSSPPNTNTTNTTDAAQPIPSTSTARRMQPSLSTRPKKLIDAKKRRSSQSIPTQQQQQQQQQPLIIPQQYKSKSYPVSRSKSTTTTIVKTKKSTNNISVKANLDKTTPEDDHQRQDISSPVATQSPPRSKASQIPVRASSTHRPSSSPPSSSRQQQQQLTVQCA